MIEAHSFTCSHNAELKPNCFGRGKSRLKRIAEYFNRPCLQCRIDSIPVYVAKFTMPDSWKESKARELAVSIPQSYRLTINEVK